MIKKLILVVIVIAILSGVFGGDWISRIPEVAGTVWEHITRITAVSGST